MQSGTPPTLLPTPFATISPIYSLSECGLIGIVFDPDFLANGYVYFFATVSNTEQQILRYTAVGNVGTNKTVVVPGLPTQGVNHDGGGLGFGLDGKLYWSIGDQGNGTGVNADLTSLAAKVGRANPDGSVPSDNPFADGPGGSNDYIFARGFRNPFTFTFQPTTGVLWVNVAGTLYEQVFAVGKGDHAGWNLYENNQPAGFLPPVIKYRTNGTDIRSLAATGGAVRSGGVATFTTLAVHGFRAGEKITVAGVADTSFNGAVYVASVPTTTTFTALQAGPNAISGGGTAATLAQGGAITGGAFYDATGAPAAYRGNFFYGDYNAGRVNRAVVGPGTAVTSVDYFATGNSNAVDVSVGPDGALYYVGIPGVVIRAAYNATFQDLVVSSTHLWMNEGRSVAFGVRLALAPSSKVAVTVSRTAGSSGVGVSGGSFLSFTPSNWSIPQTVYVSSVEDPDALDGTATITVASEGLTSESVEVLVRDTASVSGGVFPGAVPDGASVPGGPLSVRIDPLDPSRLELDWSPSCDGSAANYSIHEGTIGNWYSHDAALCTTGGATTATVVPGAGNRYYLVVPLDAEREGSYGSDSSGVERPRSNLRCRSMRVSGSCAP